MINPVSTALERELKKMIQNRIEDLSVNVCLGLNVSSMEEYREAVGRISELKEVLLMCDEAATTINKMR
jgi:phosphoribosylformylglycinamidine (FGAM) synthase PurS component